MTIAGDTEDLVDTSVWGEVVTIVRNTPTYSDLGVATDSWASVGTPNADIQPLSGANPTVAIGQERISTHAIFLPDNTDIKQGDRLRPFGWSVGSDEYIIDMVLSDEGHVECRASLVEGHG